MLRFDTQMRRADGGERAAGALPHDADPTDSKRRGLRGGFGVGFGEVWEVFGAADGLVLGLIWEGFGADWMGMVLARL